MIRKYYFTLNEFKSLGLDDLTNSFTKCLHIIFETSWTVYKIQDACRRENVSMSRKVSGGGPRKLQTSQSEIHRADHKQVDL